MIQSKKIHVLLVDDDSSQLEMSQAAISSFDESIVLETVNSAVEAMEFIHRYPFDCIVSNFITPRR